MSNEIHPSVLDPQRYIKAHDVQKFLDAEIQNATESGSYAGPTVAPAETLAMSEHLSDFLVTRAKKRGMTLSAADIELFTKPDRPGSPIREVLAAAFERRHIPGPDLSAEQAFTGLHPAAKIAAEAAGLSTAFATRDGAFGAAQVEEARKRIEQLATAAADEAKTSPAARAAAIDAYAKLGVLRGKVAGVCSTVEGEQWLESLDSVRSTLNKAITAA